MFLEKIESSSGLKIQAGQQECFILKYCKTEDPEPSDIYDILIPDFRSFKVAPLCTS